MDFHVETDFVFRTGTPIIVAVAVIIIIVLLLAIIVIFYRKKTGIIAYQSANFSAETASE